MGGEWYDPLFRLRYGVSSAEKYRQAVTGETPGAMPVRSDEDLEREERRTSAYLFAKKHPMLSATVQPGVDMLRRNVFRDSPEVVAAAQQGQYAAQPGYGPGRVQQKLFDTWDGAVAHFFGPSKP
jgi:hypothetical protein